MRGAGRSASEAGLAGGGSVDEGLTSPYTGLFVSIGAPDGQPQDPDVALWAGELAPAGPREEPTAVGGAGWSADEARAACLGEAIERFQTYPLRSDRVVEAGFRDWPLPDRAVPPEAWVLFHREQYALPGFHFRPFQRDTLCRWVACREAGTGERTWVPEEFAFLFGRSHIISPSISTGLSCGRGGDSVLLRGLQEVVERDAIMGAWWGAYPLEEWPEDTVLGALEPELRPRVRRANLRYRFYRVASPWSSHVTIATVEGHERSGFLFSAGAACREDRTSSWRKSLLEAIQGWHYVRWLKATRAPEEVRAPRDFIDHALYYSLHPDRLERTVFRRAAAPAHENGADLCEGFAAIRTRLGPDRPGLFRLVTPPSIAGAGLDWHVLKVMVPGLQPMHGHHSLPLLGGRLWAPRGWKEWAETEPHPFP